MWTHMCYIQYPLTSKALLDNLHLLFGLSQGSTQETYRYLGTIRNLISRCRLGGQDLSAPLANLISAHNLYQSHYKKVLDRYKVGSIKWSSNNLDVIDMDLTLLDQHRGMVKYPAPISAAVSSVSKCRRQTPTSNQRTQMEPTLSLSHKLFREHIKTLLWENNSFVCGNRHHNPVNCHSILETGYHMMRVNEGEAKKLANIPTGRKRHSTLTSCYQ